MISMCTFYQKYISTNVYFLEKKNNLLVRWLYSQVIYEINLLYTLNCLFNHWFRSLYMYIHVNNSVVKGYQIMMYDTSFEYLLTRTSGYRTETFPIVFYLTILRFFVYFAHASISYLFFMFFKWWLLVFRQELYSVKFTSWVLLLWN